MEFAPGEFKVERQDGGIVCVSAPAKYQHGLIVSADADAKVFHRVGIEFPGNGFKARWLVVSMDGVNVYIDKERGSIRISKKDLLP